MTAYDDAAGLQLERFEAVFVEIGGQRVAARYRPDIAPGLFVAMAGVEARAYRLHPDDPWPAVVDVTVEAEDLLGACAERPGAARLQEAQREAVRRAELRTAEGMEPVDWQRRNGAFEPERQLTTVMYREPDETGKRMVTRTERAYAYRRQKVDARIWASLSDDHKAAADDIEDGYRGVTAGLGARIMAFEAKSGGPKGQGLDRRRIPGMAKVEAFWDWQQACRWSGVSAAAVLAVIVHGASCRQVDRDSRYHRGGRGRRKGWARRNLEEGLDLYLDPEAIAAALDRAREETQRADPDLARKWRT